MSDSQTTSSTRGIWPVLSQWVIYKHPKDFPDQYVARRWEIHPGDAKPTGDYLTSPELSALRDILAKRVDHTPIRRCPGDDPCIVEVWI